MSGTTFTENDLLKGRGVLDSVRTVALTPKAAALQNRGISQKSYVAVWNALMKSLGNQMKQGKGISFPMFAKFSTFKESKKPYFSLSESFRRTYDIRMKEKRTLPVVCNAFLIFSNPTLNYSLHRPSFSNISRTQ